MNRIITALALSGLFVAAPAFAKSHVAKPVASAGDKAAAGETKSDTSPDSTKPTKKVKKVNKTTEKSGAGTAEKPAEAPTK